MSLSERLDRSDRLDRLDRLQRRHPGAGFPSAVIYKFVDDSGSYLAALITYYGFVSLFPGLLLLTTVLGIVLRGHPGLQQQILHPALSEFPIIGGQLGDPHRIGGGWPGCSSAAWAPPTGAWAWPKPSSTP